MLCVRDVWLFQLSPHKDKDYQDMKLDLERNYNRTNRLENAPLVVSTHLGVRGVTAQVVPSTYIASTCDPATIRCAQPVHASDWVTARPLHFCRYLSLLKECDRNELKAEEEARIRGKEPVGGLGEGLLGGEWTRASLREGGLGRCVEGR